MMRNGLARRRAQQQGESIDAMVRPVVKLFTPDAGGTWLLSELSPGDCDLAFGLCDYADGNPALANVRISDLRYIHGRTNRTIEKDVHFKATKSLAAYTKQARIVGYIVA